MVNGHQSASEQDPFELCDGSRIAVMGGGPAGSFFSYFLLVMAERIDLRLNVDIYEPRNFSDPGPKSCNMCGGIVSESLVQALAAEGINLPAGVVQRGIDSYVLHTDVGSVAIDTPLNEKRIASVFRGAGPRKHPSAPLPSFDAHLQSLARQKGAHIRVETIESVGWSDGRPTVATRNSSAEPYDLVVVAAGVNASAQKALKDLPIEYEPPRTVRTAIREYHLGTERMASSLGSAMHVYLLDLPRLEFAAIIPKGDSSSVCILGDDVDRTLVQSFLESKQVMQTMPTGWVPVENICQCLPRMNIQACRHPVADRVVFIGDAGVSRLYKDGIGAAYRTSKAAARAALFHGVSKKALELHYLPTCRSITHDNRLGKMLYAVAGLFRSWTFATRIMLDMVRREQNRPGPQRHMSTVLWDLFTGSAPYAEVLSRTIRPAFLWRLLCSASHVIRHPFRAERDKANPSLKQVSEHE